MIGLLVQFDDHVADLRDVTADLDAERDGDFSRKDTLLYNYEDCFLGTVASDAFEENHDAWVGPSGRRTDVLILRDPYNLFASRRRAGYAVVSGGTDTHVVLVDLRPKGVKGNAAEEALERAGMTCNKNGVPNDPEKPAVTSGIRLGTPAGTTRGFGVAEFQATGRFIARILDGLAEGGETADLETTVRGEVEELTGRFPIYGG